MDKNAIKKYAVWARRELISRVSQKAAFYGITDTDHGTVGAESVDERVLTAAEKKQRDALIHQIQKDGYEQTIEEVAYTWFNRFSALRYMEVNGYLPTHVRVFTDDTGALKPQILTEAINLELDGLDMQKVYDLKNSNQEEALYRYLLITQCNALNAILPGMFQKIEDYTELLLPDNLLREGSVIEQMVTTIPEEDWTDQVQIIGWMYQYYNAEKKDDVFAALKKNVKITKENIPAATQLFTPDWIVRYMVENSLGRIFVDKRKNEGVYADGRGLDEMTWEESEVKRIANEKDIAEQMGWKYYLPEAEQTQEVRKQLDKIQAEYGNLDVTEIKVIDPCMGSGHILVYMFDVLVKIYEAYGYSARNAVKSIVENNLYGLDIDDRAAQLAYFAVMMKARQYDRRFFSRGIQPHVYAIVESNGLDSSSVEYFTNNDPQLKKDFGTLMNELRDAKEYGSILNISQVDFSALYARVEEVRADISMFREIVLNSVLPLIQVAEVMAQKYNAVVTNPPYMSTSSAGAKLSDYVRKHYPDSKTDMFSIFIERCQMMTRSNYLYAMITMHSWMFLGSFESLRVKLMQTDTINMAHLGPRAFEEIGGEVVQTTSFVRRKSHVSSYKGAYCRLIAPTTQDGKKELYLEHKEIYSVTQDDFDSIPGNPIAYWINSNLVHAFAQKHLSDYAQTKQGFATGDNNRFLRFWHKVSASNTAFPSQVLNGMKWFPCNKGGSFRKWYGNNIYLANWYQNGSEMKAFSGSVIRNPQFYFKVGITWSSLANQLSLRYSPKGFLFESKGSMCFVNDTNRLNYILGLLNSKVTAEALSVLSPTLDFHEGPMLKVPVVLIEPHGEIDQRVEENIKLCQDDWDAFESSWDFMCHPLVASQQYAATCHQKEGTSPEHHLCAAYQMWLASTERRFQQLKANEEKLNRIFIDIYGLQNELTPEVEDKDVTVRRADLGRDIRSFISYAVGCMFGRYSLDVDGLAYAGGEWDASKYASFIADKDNIIPICDDEYFEDDIVGRFVEFVKTVYGEDTLDENLKFIADALGGKGAPKEVIRNYFLNDFYADHCKIYQKRPIYWLFDSGKKNGFKALIYMHRYREDTIARIRTDYVHEQQGRYRTAIADLESRIANADTGSRVKLTKQLTKLQNQAEELRVYEEKIHHLADQMIRIDLDDGVKHNYELFQDVLAKIK